MPKIRIPEKFNMRVIKLFNYTKSIKDKINVTEQSSRSLQSTIGSNTPSVTEYSSIYPVNIDPTESDGEYGILVESFQVYLIFC